MPKVRSESLRRIDSRQRAYCGHDAGDIAFATPLFKFCVLHWHAWWCRRPSHSGFRVCVEHRLNRYVPSNKATLHTAYPLTSPFCA